MKIAFVDQNIIFENRILEDKKTLKGYNIKDNDFLKVEPKM